MNHTVSSEDQEFARSFEACRVPPGAFDHAAHVRLAYVYLCEHPVDAAAGRIALLAGGAPGVRPA